MSQKNHLIEVRSNTNFSMNYETFQLTPQVELILLVTQPNYDLKKRKDGLFIEKGHALEEFRCNISLKGVNEMIGKLQQVAAGLQNFEQISVGLNSVIQQAIKPKTEEQP